VRTGLVWDERYMWHDPGPGAAVERAGGWIEPGDLMAETPATKRRMRNLVEVAGLLEHLVPVAPRFATEDELLRFHTREHLERVRTLSEGVGGSVGFDAWAGTGTYDIARLAAGGTMAAVDAVLDGTVDACYALVRPPGHHAMAEAGAGFCVFGNVALAVMHARAVRGVGRVAVVDWDVHHGNGTQDAFWTEPDVLALSLHQDRCLLPSGALEETGEGEGAGRTINVPLPAGSGEGAYLDAMARVVEPALRAFRPELIVVACGFDANGFDPLARMLLHSDSFRLMTRSVVALARELCDGRLVLSHEGGYSAAVTPFCGLAVLEELTGHRTSVDDPFAARLREFPGQALESHQRAVIDAAARLADAIG
jgi:acetoin utilization deacetylase AcuC-like enzyme